MHTFGHLSASIVLSRKRASDGSPDYQAVTKVTAEGESSAFCLLPQHIDWVAALVPGLLSFEVETGEEIFVLIAALMSLSCLSAQ